MIWPSIIKLLVQVLYTLGCSTDTPAEAVIFAAQSFRRKVQALLCQHLGFHAFDHNRTDPRDRLDKRI